MWRKFIVSSVAILFVTLMVTSSADAGRRGGATKGKTQTVETQAKDGTCPNGNVPGTGQALKQGSGNAKAGGFGPGDQSGNDGSGPKDGTGYGAEAQGKGKVNNPDCDGTGPKGNDKKPGGK